MSRHPWGSGRARCDGCGKMSVNWCRSGLCPVCEGAARKPATATDARSDALSDDAEFAELLGNARRLQPIETAAKPYDSAAAWGSPQTGGFTRGTAGLPYARNARFTGPGRNVRYSR